MIIQMIFLFGLTTPAYKPGTDILTESQQYQLCLELLDLGYKVYVSDDLLKDKCDARIIFKYQMKKFIGLIYDWI